MRGRIHVEIEELRRAESELTSLISKLHHDQAEIKNMYGRIQDWTGISADRLRERISQLFSELATSINRFEGRRNELAAYIRLMEETDRS